MGLHECVWAWVILGVGMGGTLDLDGYVGVGGCIGVWALQCGYLGDCVRVLVCRCGYV